MDCAFYETRPNPYYVSTPKRDSLFIRDIDSYGISESPLLPRRLRYILPRNGSWRLNFITTQSTSILNALDWLSKDLISSYHNKFGLCIEIHFTGEMTRVWDEITKPKLVSIYFGKNLLSVFCWKHNCNKQLSPTTLLFICLITYEAHLWKLSDGKQYILPIGFARIFDKHREFVMISSHRNYQMPSRAVKQTWII